MTDTFLTDAEILKLRKQLAEKRRVTPTKE